MKSILKKSLPISLIVFIVRLVGFMDRMIPPFFKNSQFLASIYYAFFSFKFGREHKAILAGKAAYQKSLKNIGDSSILLRRNTHRLEKGLIMKPRREIFAEDFIVETVKVYDLATSIDSLNPNELKWVTDVLSEYFNVVKDTEIIANARALFNKCLKGIEQEKSFIPYSFDSLPKNPIEFEDLHKLFIKRRSVRWYQNKTVPAELIEKAVNIATLAPSACNRQPYNFHVSHSKEKVLEIAKCAGGTPGWAENIPCIIVIVGDLSAYPSERDRHLIYIDGSLAAMQLMLAFETLGLSSCAINWPDIESAEGKMEKLLSLMPYERPIMLLSVGYAEAKGGIPYSQKKNAQVLIKKV
jgi:nitroreductase